LTYNGCATTAKANAHVIAGKNGAASNKQTPTPLPASRNRITVRTRLRDTDRAGRVRSRGPIGYFLETGHRERVSGRHSLLLGIFDNFLTKRCRLSGPTGRTLEHMKQLIASTLTLMSAVALPLLADPAPAIFGAAGPDAAAIRSAVTAFQEALGPLNPPGPNGNPDGRREINWDGVPAGFSAPNNLPPDFFNKNSVRGAVFSVDNPGWTGFQVSANEADGGVRFDTSLPGYSSVFTTFSAQKLFSSIGTNDYNVDFFVPGTEVKGKVKGFGAVFTNVALPFTTSIELYNSDGLLLGRFFAPVAAKGLSFVGVTFPHRMVTRVRIIPGNAALGNADDPANGKNIVVADDFLYGEPVSDCVQN